MNAAPHNDPPPSLANASASHAPGEKVIEVERWQDGAHWFALARVEFQSAGRTTKLLRIGRWLPRRARWGWIDLNSRAGKRLINELAAELGDSDYWSERR